MNKNRFYGKLTWLFATCALIGAVACTRSAEQQNFLGKPCNSEGDCPVELQCYLGACRATCGPGDTCPEGTTCQAMVCLPSGVTAGDDNPGDPRNAGTLTPGGSAAGVDGGANLPGTGTTPKLDGTRVATNVPFQNGSTYPFTIGEAGTVYAKSVSDIFGTTTTTLYHQPFGGAERALRVLTSADTTYAMMGTSVNGDAYYDIAVDQQTMSRRLRRTRLADGAVTTFPSVEVSDLGPCGTYLCVRSQSSILYLFDTSAGAFTSTAGLGDSDGAGAVVVSGKVTWLADDGNGLKFFQAPSVSAAGVATGKGFDPGIQVTFLLLDGDDAILLASSGNLIRANIRDTSAAYTLIGPVGRFESSTIVDNQMYVREHTNFGQPGDELLLQVYDAKLAKRKLGTFGSSNANSLTVGSTNVFATIYEYNGTGAGSYDIYRWAR